MSRLFLDHKSVAFFNDVTKEVIKDINGQKIYYYPISTMKSKIHPIYNESTNKIFEQCLIIDCLVGQPKWEAIQNQFGVEKSATLEVFIQGRDLIDKQITLSEGDYFTYGDTTYEVQSLLDMNNIYGQEEYNLGYKIMARLARIGVFDPKKLFQPGVDNNLPFAEQDGNGIQQTFVQQRGLPENEEREITGDVRQMRERLEGEMADIDGPRKIGIDETEKTNTFYHE